MQREKPNHQDQRATKKIRPSNSEFSILETFTILKVNKIEEGKPLIILAIDESTQETKTIILFDQYSNFEKIQEKMSLSMPKRLTENEIQFQKISDNYYFIVEPKILISPKILNGSNYCDRKQILSEFFTDHSTKKSFEVFKGSIVHKFFQSLISGNQNILQPFDENQLQVIMKKDYMQNLCKFYQIGMEFEAMYTGCQGLYLNCIKWVQQYCQKKEPLKIECQTLYHDIRIIQWEQNESKLTSLDYGLTGVIDVVLKVQFRERYNNRVFESLIPLELKTGTAQKNYESTIQTYAFLMSVHQKKIFPFGLILYLGDNKLQLIPSGCKDQLDILFKRNLYVLDIQHTELNNGCYKGLPQLRDTISTAKKLETKCNKCELQSVCIGLHLLHQEEDPESTDYNQIKGKYQLEDSKEYLNKMLACLRKEEKATILPQIVYSVKQIDNNSQCYVCLSTELFEINQAQEIINKYYQDKKVRLTSVSKQVDFQIENSKASLIKLNEYSNNAIKLEISFDQVSLLNQNDLLISIFFQKNYFKQYRKTIVDLCVDKKFKEKKDLLISKKQPIFSQKLDPERSQALILLNQKFSQKLNNDQIEVIKMCLQAENYALVLGYPGTGKTYTIAHLLFLLSSIKKKVLVCTYTHAALDNLLEKLVKEFPKEAENIVRLASTKNENVSLCSKEFLLSFDKFNDISGVKEFLKSKYLYFTTCLSVNEALDLQQFDYCIVEEASQIIEPLCIQCILQCKVFILIGDYKQLQPLTKSKEETILKKSLLQRLDEQKQNPQCSKSLTIQYRMNSQIMEIANSLIYENQLQLCQESQGLILKELSNPTEFERRLHNSNESVLFLDTKNKEEEIKSAGAVVKFLLQNGLKQEQLLTITTYNKSVDHLKNEFKKFGTFEIITIDKSQGKEGACVLVICSEVEDEKDHLLQNIQRCNVACTRAKNKFIMIGNSAHLNQKEKIKDLIEIFKKKQKIFSVDPEFLKKYS